MSVHRIEQIRWRLIRWRWEWRRPDGRVGVMGWTATKWGARRAIRRAEREAAEVARCD